MGLLNSLRGMLGGGRVDLHKRFEYLQELPAGTMSTVWQVRDRESGNIVALKVLDPQKVAEFDARFKGIEKPTEGELTLALEHPHIVKALDHGISSQGEPFLVLEFLSGPNLHDLTSKQSELLTGHRLQLARQAAGALAAVHEAGFMHRDVCPHNFIASRDGRSLKLIDFSLSLPARPEFCKPGNRTGKADYMAPELIRRQATDQRVDIFAFGVTLFELCVGKLPWPSGSAQEAIKRSTQPPPPVREYNAEVPDSLAGVMHRCLEPDVGRRAQTMQEVVERLSDARESF